AAGNVHELVVTLPRAALVRGTVQRGGLGAAGVQVRATWAPSALLPQQEVVAADGDGMFRFTACGLGPPALDVRLPGEPLWRAAAAFTTWNGDDARIVVPADFTAAAWLQGTLRCDGGGALAGARVFVRRDGVQWAEVGCTDGRGAFRLGPLPAGSYDLFAEA